VRANERTAIPRPSGSPAYLYEPISYKKTNRSMDGYIVTVGPNFPPEPLIHEGEEITCVLEGRQEFVYDRTSYLLSTGDCCRFDSNKLHYSRSLGDRPAKLLVVFASKKIGPRYGDWRPKDYGYAEKDGTKEFGGDRV
jgi:mannose-6-phosphate isomerase-like protein (cupin superfamily)